MPELRLRIKIPILMAVFLALIGAFVSNADEPAVKPVPSPAALKAWFDKKEAKIGDTVVLTLEYSLPLGARLPQKPQIKGLEDLSVIKIENALNQVRLGLIVDQLDQIKTGEIELAYLDVQGEIRTVSTEAVSMDVFSNLGERPEEAELKPIEDIIPIRPWWLKWIPYAAAGVAVLLFLLGIFFWLKARRRKKASKQIIAPHEKALKDLAELEAEGFLARGLVKNYYFRFSEILRRYLEEIRGFPAAEYTTQEIAQVVSNQQDRDLLPLLRGADLVKFADHEPLEATTADRMKQALTYINSTGEQADAPVPPAGKGVES